MSTVKANAILDASGGNTATINGMTPTADSLQGFRNRLINGGMAVDQRNAGASQTITAAAALAYTVDRWYAYCTGANVTGQQVAGSGINQYRYRFTGAASVTKIGFAQRIEQLNCYDLNGTTATLSVDLANSLLTTVTWTAWYANTANTFGTLASPTRTQIATGTFTVNSTVTRYSTNISIPAAATTGIEIEFSVGAQTSGTWTIGNVQLEAGSVATPFERRPYGTELALCQRYLPAFISSGTASAIPGSGIGAAPTYISYNIPFMVQTRVAPTGVSISSGAHFSVDDGVTISACDALTFNTASPYGAQVLPIRSAAGLTQYRPYNLRFNNASGQLLFTGCEL